MGAAQGRITVHRKPNDGSSVTIISTTVRYSTETTSASQPSDSTFTLTAIPTDLPSGAYLWGLTMVTYNDGTITKTYAVSRIGANATVYEIVTNIDTLRTSSEDVEVKIRITNGTSTTLESIEWIQEDYGLTLTATLAGKDATGYIEYTSDSQIYWGGESITLKSGNKLVIKLWKDGKQVAEKCLTVVADGANGADGAQGIQGIQGCVLRTSEWIDGIEYRNDEALTSGTRFIDIVVVKSSSGGVDGVYKCKRTHEATEGLKPADSPSYWEEFNTLSPIYTPMIFADKALLRISQTNQLLVTDDDDNVIGLFGGGTYPLQVGDNFKVDQNGKAYMTGAEISGKVTAGDTDGQRVEIQPDNRIMAVYDEDGEPVVSYEGNTITAISQLFSSLSGSFSVKSRTSTDAGYSSGVTYGKGKNEVVGEETIKDAESQEIIITSAVYSSVPIEVLVSGAIHSEYNIPTLQASTSVGNTFTPEFVTSASASIILRVDTYSDSALTTLVGSAIVSICQGSFDTKILSSAKAKTAVGGYHVLKLITSVSALGEGTSAEVSWGAAIGSTYSNISATYTTESKVARYFANGFCIGNSDADYVWAYNQGSTSNGMRFVMENNGYGLDVSSSGIKYKHHSGAWMNMPLLVFNGTIKYNGSSYSVYNSKSYDGNTPTLSRTAEGKVRMTFPSAWSGLSLSASNMIINCAGLGYNYGSTSNIIKANILSITSTYIDVGLSDDQSANDGNFIINISII